jgi:hypothetical protein
MNLLNVILYMVLLSMLASCNGGGGGGGGAPAGDVAPSTTTGSSGGGGQAGNADSGIADGASGGSGDGTTGSGSAGGATTGDQASGGTTTGLESGGASGGTTASGSDSGGTGGTVIQNTPPTISFITTKTINEDSSLDNVTFTISDAEQALSCQSSVSIELRSDTVSSYNPNVILLNKISISGTAPNCVLSLSPELNEFGGIRIILNLTDGEYVVARNFQVIVAPLDDTVSLTQIPNQTTQKNVLIDSIPFKFSDPEIPVTCGSPYLRASSSNQSVVLGSSLVNPNMEFSGTAPNCFFKITPVQNASGKTTITVYGTDNPYTSQRNVLMSFELSVFGDVPQISSILDVTFMEDNGTGNMPFTITDSDTALDCSKSVVAKSTNTDLIGLSDISIGGTAPNCLYNIKSKLNAYGSSIITLEVTDGLSSSTTSFNALVLPSNDAPTMSALINRGTYEDVPFGPIPFTISDVDSPLDCSASISKTSAKLGVLPLSGIEITGTAPNCFLRLVPNAQINGANFAVTLTVSDGSLSATRSFTFNVIPVNDPPVISGVVDQSTNEDTISGYQKVVMTDIDSILTCPTALTASSSDQSVVLNSGIEISKIGSDCYIRVTPVASASGVVVINLTVSDGLLSATASYNLNVIAVNDPPTISTVANQSIAKNGSVTNISFSISDVDNTLSCSSSLTRTSSNELVLPLSGIIISGLAPNCNLSITPLFEAIGGATVSLKLSDGVTNVTSKFNTTVDFNNFTKLTGGTSAYVGSTSFVTDVAGNTYYAGSTTNSLDGQFLSGGATSNGLVVKYNKYGTKIWTKLFSVNPNYTDAHKVILDPMGDNIYISGTTKGSTALVEGFLLKMSSASSITWFKKFSSTSVSSISDMASNGTEIFISGAAGTSMIFVKINNAGTFQWLKSYNIGTTTYSDRVRMIYDGTSFYFSGTTTSNLNGVVKTGTSDIFLMKCDLSGNAIWTKLLGAASSISKSLEIFKLNNMIHLFGISNGSIDGVVGELFFVKYDLNGSRSLSTILYLPNLMSTMSWNPINIDTLGNIYVANGNAISKFSSLGESIFNRSITGFSQPYAINIDSFGNIFTLGQTSSTLEGQGPAGVYDAYFSTRYSFE